MLQKPSSLKKKRVKTVALAIALPNLAFAATTESPIQLPTIHTKAEQKLESYRGESSSSKRTEKLLNTAKTTQIITEQALKDQNLLSLQDALATTPGITFGAGEGGGGYGDKIVLRGYDAQFNTTIDGLRDAGWQTRSDLFNYEAVEVTKGADSAENGVGQVSGGINLVSKKPSNRDSNTVLLGKGTDDYTRFTGDFNKVLNETVAARLNVMGHQDTYPGRSEERKRWGIAPSVTIGINDDTKATLSYVHQEDENLPVHGVPFFNARPVPGISPSNYYGYKNLDLDNQTSDVATIKVESRLSDHVKFNSISRYSDLEQETIVSVPRGTFCLGNGMAPTDYATDPSGFIACDQPGEYTPGGPRGYHNLKRTKQIANDSNFVSQFKTGFIEHSLVSGIGLSQEEYSVSTGSLNLVNVPTMNVYNPEGYWYGAINPTLEKTGEGQLNIYSVYLFDTLKLHPQWMLNLGTRFDRTEGQYQNLTNSTRTQQNDSLFSYQAGLIFKPTTATSLYASFANAQKPTQNTANAGCTTGTNCNTDPEEARSYELGAKWEANPNLLLSAALFRNEQNKVRSASDLPGQENVLNGKNHVDGVELGITGNILPDWDITANLAYMEGKYDKSYRSGNTAIKRDDKLTNLPDWSGSLWSTYKLDEHWKLGYGLTYQGGFYINTSTENTKQLKTEDYLVHNASITYDYSKNLGFQLVGRNLSDKEYYTHVRTAMSSAFAQPGEGRSAVFNINYKF